MPFAVVYFCSALAFCSPAPVVKLYSLVVLPILTYSIMTYVLEALPDFKSTMP